MSYRNPAAAWIASPNFWANRNGHDMAVSPSVVVIHTVVGTLAGAVATFQSWANQKSAHYIVGEDGRLVQMVDEGDAAWHAGTQVVNEDSIGIEHEDLGQPNSPRPDALYATSARLVRGICQRYGIPIAHGNYGAGISGVVAHRDVFQTGCPDTLDVDRIIREAAAGGTEMFHGAPDFDAIANQMTGIGGTPNPSLTYFNAIRDGLNAIYNATVPNAGLLAAVKAELDVLKAEVEAGGSVDAAAAIGRIEAALKAA
jgi:hypothetical protein